MSTVPPILSLMDEDTPVFTGPLSQLDDLLVWDLPYMDLSRESSDQASAGVCFPSFTSLTNVDSNKTTAVATATAAAAAAMTDTDTGSAPLAFASSPFSVSSKVTATLDEVAHISLIDLLDVNQPEHDMPPSGCLDWLTKHDDPALSWVKGELCFSPLPLDFLHEGEAMPPDQPFDTSSSPLCSSMCSGDSDVSPVDSSLSTDQFSGYSSDGDYKVGYPVDRAWRGADDQVTQLVDQNVAAEVVHPSLMLVAPECRPTAEKIQPLVEKAARHLEHMQRKAAQQANSSSATQLQELRLPTGVSDDGQRLIIAEMPRRKKKIGRPRKDAPKPRPAGQPLNDEEMAAFVAHYRAMRANRYYGKALRYKVRSDFAVKRCRIGGRFVKKELDVAIQVMHQEGKDPAEEDRPRKKARRS